MKDRMNTKMGLDFSAQQASGPHIEAIDQRKGAIFVQQSRHGGHGRSHWRELGRIVQGIARGLEEKKEEARQKVLDLWNRGFQEDHSSLGWGLSSVVD